MLLLVTAVDDHENFPVNKSDKIKLKPEKLYKYLCWRILECIPCDLPKDNKWHFSLSGALSWVNELAETCRGLRRSKFKQNADWGRSPPLFFCSYFEFQKIELKGCAWVSVGRRAGAGALIPEVDIWNFELRIPFALKFSVECH